jgi:predicted GNAT superfamily acetyltransferase
MTITYSIHELPLTDELLAELRDLHVQVLDSDVTAEDFARRARRKSNLLICLTRCDGALVGYKIGFERNTDEFHSWIGGMIDGYRRQGIAAELMRRQHARAAELGFQRVVTTCLNSGKPMMIANLKTGFDIIGTMTDNRGLKVIFSKELV